MEDLNCYLKMFPGNKREVTKENIRACKWNYPTILEKSRIWLLDWGGENQVIKKVFGIGSWVTNDMYNDISG